MLNLLKRAINEKRRIAFQYQGNPRTVEPHLVGINSKLNEALRAFQTGGKSTSGRLPAWKMFLIKDIENIEILNEVFEINPQFNPDDKQMKSILFRVSN